MYEHTEPIHVSGRMCTEDDDIIPNKDAGHDPPQNKDTRFSEKRQIRQPTAESTGGETHQSSNDNNVVPEDDLVCYPHQQ